MATLFSGGSTKRSLSVFALVMINVIAVDSLRTLPFSAKLGLPLVFYYVVCALGFFIPVGLVTAELATFIPERGGIYAWVKLAVGEKLGFLVVWLQWVYNIVWYPTILGLIASVLAHLLDPSLAESKLFIVTVVCITFWAATLLNCFGMEVSSWISAIGSIFGTLIPMAFIIALGVGWLVSGEAREISFTWQELLPTINSPSDLVLVTTILFGLVGLEMSAVHAQEVKNPSRDYPIAIFISSFLIFLSLTLASLAIAIVIPQAELNVVTGLLQAYAQFFTKLNLGWLYPIVNILIIIGALGSICAWVIGPPKGILAATQQGNFPKWLSQTNSKGVPISLLLLQAVVTTLLSLGYIFLPSIEGAYFFLTELTSILALTMYLFFFIAAIVLRYKDPRKRPFTIPGGKLGIWLVAGMGFITTLAALIISFIPPSDIDVGSTVSYQLSLIVGSIVFALPAFLLAKSK